MFLESTQCEISQLTYHLHLRTLHPELFEIYLEKAHQFKDLSLKLRLCHSGHMIEVTYEDRVVLTETLTNRSRVLPAFKQHTFCEVKGNQHDSFAIHPDLIFHCYYHLEYLKEEQYQNYHHEMQRDAEKAALNLHYVDPSRFQPDGISLINVANQSNSLSFQCFHTFPHEQAVVKTQSLIELV